MTQPTDAPRVDLPGADKGGAWVQMGDKQYKIAPLNFKSLQLRCDDLQVLSGVSQGAMPTGEQLGALVRLAHASLKRNYPTIIEDEVAEDLDFGNFSNVLRALMGASALTNREVPKVKEGEPQPS